MCKRSSNRRLLHAHPQLAVALCFGCHKEAINDEILVDEEGFDENCLWYIIYVYLFCLFNYNQYCVAYFLLVLLVILYFLL